MTLQLSQARSVAALYFEGAGRADDARTVRAGGGDDFPEVQVALLAGRLASKRLEQYRAALETYADTEFWDADLPEATLAFHDAGEIARSALAGRAMFDLHRD